MREQTQGYRMREPTLVDATELKCGSIEAVPCCVMETQEDFLGVRRSKIKIRRQGIQSIYCNGPNKAQTFTSKIHQLHRHPSTL